MNLVDLWKKVGSCAAFCIRFGYMFFSEAITQKDDEISPLLLDVIKENTLSPRILPAYSILYLIISSQMYIHCMSIMDYVPCMVIDVFICIVHVT